MPRRAGRLAVPRRADTPGRMARRRTPGRGRRRASPTRDVARAAGTAAAVDAEPAGCGSRGADRERVTPRHACDGEGLTRFGWWLPAAFSLGWGRYRQGPQPPGLRHARR